MAAVRGRQITNFGGFFDPFGIGTSTPATQIGLVDLRLAIERAAGLRLAVEEFVEQSLGVGRLGSMVLPIGRTVHFELGRLDSAQI